MAETPRRGGTSMATLRSKLILETAAELVGAPEWPDKQVRVQFRQQGAPDWKLCLFASDAPNAVDAVVAGEADIAICNPGGVLAMALRGAGPFKEPVPVRALLVMPQFDQLGFAVAARTGLRSLGDIRDERYPLKVSLRGQPDHSVHLVADQVLRAYGFSLNDLVSWGGQVRYDPGLPTAPGRLDAVERGEIDAVFDEGMPSYANRALEMGMRFLAVDEPELQQLEAIGLRRVAITRQEFPKLPEEEVWTVDFSGWPIFTLESARDEMVTAFCAAIEARKDRIPWYYGRGPLQLDAMVRDTREAPVTIPFHPAAERYWREHGYL